MLQPCPGPGSRCKLHSQSPGHRSKLQAKYLDLGSKPWLQVPGPSCRPKAHDKSPGFQAHAVLQECVHCLASMCPLSCRYAYTVLHVLIHCFPCTHTPSCRYVYTILQVHIHCLTGTHTPSCRYMYIILQVHIHHLAGMYTPSCRPKLEVPGPKPNLKASGSSCLAGMQCLGGIYTLSCSYVNTVLEERGLPDFRRKKRKKKKGSDHKGSGSVWVDHFQTFRYPSQNNRWDKW